jgi:glutamate synthase domain-containing protein 1
MSKGFNIHDEVKKRRALVDERLASLGVQFIDRENATEYAFRYRIQYDGDMKKLADYVEDVEGAEILSMGNALELIKDLGDAGQVADQYGLRQFKGTHGIGHTRMATESDVDIRSAHPYWAYPYNDIAVVHNGQLTNYWVMRRTFERKGHRFVSNCDSELLAVYTAYNLEQGATLEESLKQSIQEIDGVFTYLVSTKDALGMAKDTMAAKPMVLFESDRLVALASEEVAIRTTRRYVYGGSRSEKGSSLARDGNAYRGTPRAYAAKIFRSRRSSRRIRISRRSGRRFQPARRA